MALEKFKICPACEERNSSSRLECQKCETDLAGVRIVDEGVLLNAQCEPIREDSTTSNGDSGLVKNCDCGTANLPQARKCTACGEDISDIRPEKSCNPNTPKRYVLRSVGGGCTFILEKPVTIIGRETDMKDYLLAKSYVSRQHAKFTVTDNGVYIENISTTNRTFINNSPISGDAPTLLKNGDEIGIGGKVINGNRQNEAAYFILEATP